MKTTIIRLLLFLVIFLIAYFVTKEGYALSVLYGFAGAWVLEPVTTELNNR